MAKKKAKPAAKETAWDKLNRQFLELGKECNEKNTLVLVRALHLVTQELMYTQDLLEIHQQNNEDFKRDVIHYLERIAERT